MKTSTIQRSYINDKPSEPVRALRRTTHDPRRHPIKSNSASNPRRNQPLHQVRKVTNPRQLRLIRLLATMIIIGSFCILIGLLYLMWVYIFL